ncbi:MAG: T9SS type A sorting domain-containing protein [Saprospiraceae bacterium]|nr:T9SS type A sorting domain-containing protein [Saprospiraceae bacterium]
MNLKAVFIIVWQLFSLVFFCFGKENPNNRIAFNPASSFVSDCVRPTTQYNMSVNNVRAKIRTGGDFFEMAGYITPVPASGQLPVSAIYIASIWLAGKDIAGNIRLSASTYRTEGYDYFAGPLDVNGTTESQTCKNWDQRFSVNGDNIKKHIQEWNNAQLPGQDFDCTKIPVDVKYWPAQGNPYFAEKYGWELPDQPLAAYWDYNGDGKYNPCDGDYPMLDDDKCQKGFHEGKLVPAEMNFLVYNDNGNEHTLSGPNRLQMEIQVNAFAYSAHDELNDMTFYQYKLINKSQDDLTEAYISWFVDPDLGCHQDDYIGYDPVHKMAFAYNQDAIDGINGSSCDGTNTYGSDIPMIGFDFFKSPLAPKNFLKDEAGNIVFDADGNKVLIDPLPGSVLSDTLIELGITSFNYMENGSVGNFPAGTHEPRSGSEDGFYNYMKGLWRDGSPLSFGGSGFNPGSTDTVKFAFPGNPNDSGGWSMCTSNLANGDRKTLISAGPMLMQAGSVNQFTSGIFTAFDVKHPCPDISKLRYTNAIAQNLFDHCFEGYVSGPDAPELLAEKKDKEIVLHIMNEESSNNYQESYSEIIPSVSGQFDRLYKFEGYKVYQVRFATTSRQLLNDVGSARLIAQSDLQNNITEIFNWKNIVNPDSTSADDYIWVKESKVVASNTGINKSISFTEDQFATGDKTLNNGKNYFFMVVAYAHNNWKEFDPTDGSGQKNPYIESLTNVKVFTFAPKFNLFNEKYQFDVTRISGEGNPKIFLEVKPDMYDKMLGNNFDGKVNYLTGYGPLQGKVLDPAKLQNKKYRLEITGNINPVTCELDNSGIWKLTNITENKVILENIPLAGAKEYIEEELGFAITVHQHREPGTRVYENNGGIGLKVEYSNPNGPKWYNAVTEGGIIDENKINELNYVRENLLDPDKELSRIGEGFFIPSASVKYGVDPIIPFYLTPFAIDVSNATLFRLRDLNNVDIVLTKDKSKWSKCIVVESAKVAYTNIGFPPIGNAKEFSLRRTPSIDKDGNTLSDGTFGYSYFPGYAVDVETGRRLNIFFGENSVFSGPNASLLENNIPIGGDLIFNPSSQITSNSDQTPLKYVAGGQHYIYITRDKYDGCVSYGSYLGQNNTVADQSKVNSAVTWTSFPILSPETQLLPLSQGLIPNDVILKIRVDNPYGKTRFYDITQERNCKTEDDFPVYEFGFSMFTSSTNSTILSNISLSPNPVFRSQSEVTLSLFHLPEHVNINIFDLNGNLVKRCHQNEGVSEFFAGPGVKETRFNINSGVLSQGLHFVQITDQKSGDIKTLKWMVL